MEFTQHVNESAETRDLDGTHRVSEFFDIAGYEYFTVASLILASLFLD